MTVNIGFIGVGVIGSALVTGLSSVEDLDYNITLSPRNAKNSANLAKKFNNVKVASSNQEVLDNCEWIVLSIVPQLGDQIIKPLSFRKDHRVINLMSDRKLPELASWIGKTRTLVHMVPLPFASKRIGPIVIYPKDEDVAKIFSPIGEIITVDKVEKVEALAAITALMSPYYELLWEVVKWGKEKGLTLKESNDYTTAFFQALSIQAHDLEGMDLGSLAKEMTPGGINEMALNKIKDENSLKSWTDSLESALKRLKK